MRGIIPPRTSNKYLVLRGVSFEECGRESPAVEAELTTPGPVLVRVQYELGKDLSSVHSKAAEMQRMTTSQERVMTDGFVDRAPAFPTRL
jgi:hypothetical protein